MTPSNKRSGTPGLIVLFGSGEMSPTGRRIHEDVFKRLGYHDPVRIGILETPTGFEVNAIHGWPERMEQFFLTGLSNYKPIVTRIRAWRRDGAHSTNDPEAVDEILTQEYLYCGAGSPGYTVKHLVGTRAYENLKRAHESGATLCLGSATAVAVSAFALPVYEIFKAGADLHWIAGLNFLSPWLPNLAIVPHWNNAEGEDFDTTRCWMGTDRFARLVAQLPVDAAVLGIDEQTACVLDTEKETIQIYGVGNGYVLKDGSLSTYGEGTSLPFSLLR